MRVELVRAQPTPPPPPPIEKVTIEVTAVEARALYAVANWHGQVASEVAQRIGSRFVDDSRRATKVEIDNALRSLFYALNEAYAKAGLPR